MTELFVTSESDDLEYSSNGLTSNECWSCGKAIADDDHCSCGEEIPLFDRSTSGSWSV